MDELTYLKDVASLQLDTEKCGGCTMCLLVCPHAVFQDVGGKAWIAHLDACMECGGCVQNCPTAAISVRTGVGCAKSVMSQLLGRDEAVCAGCDSECERE